MHSPSKLSLKNFHIVGMIAEGAYSEVYEAIYLKTNKKVALKKIYKETISQHQKFDEVYVERYVMKTLSAKHPGIVQFIGSFQDKEFLYFVTEFCPYGDLGYLLMELRQRRSQEIDWLIRAYLYQVANTIIFLHEQGIAHLDIKPKNIVIDQFYNLKFIDFATCYFFDPSQEPEELKMQRKKQQLRIKRKPSYDFDTNSSICKQKFVGTPEYVSPEMLQHSKASKEADLWALGCIIYEFYYGKQPFTDSSENKIFNNILNLKFNLQDSHNMVPADAQDLISQLLNLNSNERLFNKKLGYTYNCITDHPYFDMLKSRDYIPWVSPIIVPEDFKTLHQELLAKQSMQSVMFGMREEKQHQIRRTSRLKTIIEEMDDGSSPFLSSRTLLSKRIIEKQKTDESEIIKPMDKTIGFVMLDKRRWFCIPQIALLLAYLNPPCLFIDIIKGEKIQLNMDPSVQCSFDGRYYILSSKTYNLRFKDMEAKPINWGQIVSTIKKEYMKKTFK